MSQAERIRAVAARLKAEGYDTAALERMKSTLDVEANQRQLEAEVQQEMAFALGRTGKKLEHALEALAAAELALEAAALEELPAAEALYEAARVAALEARRHYIIHREAIGIRDNRDVPDRYPIPERRASHR
ncbi:MAG: hypothetical protein KC933_19825 [Myxococcales bacterium]|nr:hypothetical protein [Myxococcales bacterium]MCB9650216.1 hypothetical protein [Deltaproteobacteria bacterium]